MKPLLLILINCVLAWPQEPAKTQEAKPAEAAKETPAAKEEPKKEEPKEAGPERWWEGTFDVGYRWQEGVRGNFDTYRSVVNLGEGVRLLDWDGRIEKGQWRAITRGSGWGGDPAEWLQFSLEKRRVFRITADHRSTALFNALPSYGNPLLDSGILMSQRTLDTRRRLTELNLDIFPTRRWIPFVAFSRDRGVGRGVTDFTSDGNEYPVQTSLSDRSNILRGGLRVEFDRLHVTLEQGGIGFRDDQTLSNSSRLPGNATRPVLGQTLFLSNLVQGYEVEGSSIFSRALATAQPVNWLDLSGSLQFSQPRNDVRYRQQNAGLFYDQDSLAFFNNQNISLLANAKQPHLTANAGVEIRPFQRFRITDSIVSDQLHNSSNLQSAIADRLEWSYNQHQTEAIFEPWTRLTLRGGYRYTWGSTVTRAPVLRNANSERGDLERHSVLGGGAFRLTDKAAVNADVEIARSDRVIFRTSLTDFERLRLRGRYQLKNNLRLYGTVQYLNNSNPPQMLRYEFRSQQTALGLHWMPRGGNTMQLTGEYSRTTLRSDLNYLIPQAAQPERSLYRENAHSISGFLTYRMAVGWTYHPMLSAGGYLFLANGSRPTNFYQPSVRLSAPCGKHFDVFAEYRYYGMTQQFYTFEGFRSHQGIVGIRVR